MPIYNQGSFPPAYGSRQDPRYTDVTQLDAKTTERLENNLEELEYDVTEDEVTDAELQARPLSETPAWAPTKQIFQFIYLPLATTAIQDGQFAIPFSAQSLRIDNFTPGWFFISQLRVYIPPDWYGAIFSCTGIKAVNILYQAPGGIANVAVTNINSPLYCVAHSERLTDVAGTKRI